MLAIATPLAADRNDVESEKLQQLRGRIQQLQTQLDETRGQRDSVHDELRDYERRIGMLVNGLKQLDARRAADNSRIARLTTHAKAEQQNLVGHRAALEDDVRTAYVLGRQEYVKLLLNQQDPTTVARVMIYYRYLNEARLETIATIQGGLYRIEQLDAQIRDRQRGLTALRAAEDEKRQSLETARARRGELLASLNQRVKNQSEEIERLLSDQRRLQQLLGQIQPLLPDMSELPGSAARFINFRGRLPLPIVGQITARYGDPKNIGDLKWRGIFVSGSEGQHVISVFRGRVAYADWLRGFGLLLILDHGDGYMTLYGHNQSLFKQVGDWVEAGEIIAAVGNTGDAPRAGLYFEIRHDGVPSDPLKWCKSG